MRRTASRFDHLGLLQRITALANVAEDEEAALVHAAEIVCETLDWPLGEAVWTQADGSRHTVGGRGGPTDAAQLGPTFERLTTQVLTDGEPRWAALPDGAPATGGRTKVGGAVALPVGTGSDVLGVLRFGLPDASEPDAGLLLLLTELGGQLGVLVDRLRARRELERVNDELRRSNRDLEHFAYVASHDLREPLRKMVGFGELLEERHRDQLDDEAQEFLDYIISGGRRMQRLLEDLLSYSRAGRRELARTPVDLDAVTDIVLQDLQRAADESGATIDVVEPLGTALGDQTAVYEILQNLIANAIRYGSDDGPPAIVISSEQHDGRVSVRVSDDGPGIPVDKAEAVFELFTRLHDRVSVEGTGTGLALARRLAGQLGGSIELEPHTSGATFRVDLPTQPRMEGGRP